MRKRRIWTARQQLQAESDEQMEMLPYIVGSQVVSIELLSKTSLQPVGRSERILRCIRDIDKVLESGYFLQIRYRHHVLRLWPMPFLHRMSHYECHALKFRCLARCYRLTCISFSCTQQDIIEHCRIRGIAGYLLCPVGLAITVSIILEIAADH